MALNIFQAFKRADYTPGSIKISFVDPFWFSRVVCMNRKRDSSCRISLPSSVPTMKLG